MNKDNWEKIAFVCFLAAAICFYLVAVIGLVRRDGSPWVVNLCLGSAMLCLSTTHLHKDR